MKGVIDTLFFSMNQNSSLSYVFSGNGADCLVPVITKCRWASPFEFSDIKSTAITNNKSFHTDQCLLNGSKVADTAAQDSNDPECSWALSSDHVNNNNKSWSSWEEPDRLSSSSGSMNIDTPIPAATVTPRKQMSFFVVATDSGQSHDATSLDTDADSTTAVDEGSEPTQSAGDAEKDSVIQLVDDDDTLAASPLADNDMDNKQTSSRFLPSNKNKLSWVTELVDMDKMCPSKVETVSMMIDLSEHSYLLCIRDDQNGSVVCDPLCLFAETSFFVETTARAFLCSSTALRDDESTHLSVDNESCSESLLCPSDDDTNVINNQVAEEAQEVLNINESDDKSDNFSEDNIKGQESEVVQDVRWSRHRVVQVQSLDEYKKSVIEKQRQDPSSKPAVVMNGSSAPTMNYQPLHQSQQEGRSKVNYADVSHGAKLVAWNKDAKGASNLLVPDKDKYLRNPCSVDEKFVVVELAEETLVDTVVIGNLEFHSSNLKNFELLGSPEVYPTEKWINLGTFEAENVRHLQNFTLAEPKWVRTLKLRLLTHHGSEFYCTLTAFQVFGVDAIERLLEDWIVGDDVDRVGRRSVPNATSSMLRNDGTKSPPSTNPVASPAFTASSEITKKTDEDSGVESLDTIFEPLEAKDVAPKGEGDGNGVPEERRKEDGIKGLSTGTSQQEWLHLSGRLTGESVLKILMQKVKMLELNQSLLDGYLGDLYKMYKEMFMEIDKDLVAMTSRLQNESASTASLTSRLQEDVSISLSPSFIFKYLICRKGSLSCWRC